MNPGLLINGTLTVRGSAAQPVQFVGASTASGSWYPDSGNGGCCSGSAGGQTAALCGLAVALLLRRRRRPDRVDSSV